MKIVFKKERLLGVLGVVANVAPQRSTRPILQNAKVEVSGEGAVTFSATDLEVSVRWTLKGAECDGEGPFLLPAGRALSIVREAPGDSVTLQADGEHVVISAGRARFRLNSAPVEDFPVQPEAPGDDVALDGDVLASMVDRTAFAVAREDFRYAINGLYVCVEGSRVEMAGSDGHRLAAVSHPLKKKAGKKMEVIAPPKLLQEFLRTYSVLRKERKGGDDTAGDEGASAPVCGISSDEGQVFIRIGEDVVISGRQLEGNYPPFREVVPKERAEKIRVGREELLAALRRVQTVTTEETRSVVFEVEGNTLKLSAADPSVGSAEEEMEVEYSGPKRMSAFDPRLLSDGLKALKEGSVALEMEDDVEAAAMREGDYVYVIMPMRIRR